MRLEIQILGLDRSSTSGNTLLRMMKNTSMSVLDILVRESVQNSLDAARPESQKVRMDFGVGTFDSQVLASEFPYIKSELLSRHGSKRDYLSIRDSGTTGLTGIDDMKNVNTRLQSLIYQIGKDTKTIDSGGSYGYGKTTFFRVGIGLVIYYSRIYENGRYVNLLAATLVEDENANPMVKKEESRGIAYFGVPDSDSHNIDPDRRTSLPITDDIEIKRILDIFGIPLYSGTETGTDVIIPFIDTESLLQTIRPSGSDNLPKWMLSLEDCLYFLIQRWYSPRLNPGYGQKWLQASVNNGPPISNSYMEYTFRLVQDLYLYALNDGYTSSIPGVSMVRSSIKKSSVSILPLGYVTAACVDKSVLKLDDRPNRDIDSVIGRKNDSISQCVFTYTRRPGMLIRYETEGRWHPNLTLDEDHVLIAMFVLNSQAPVKGESYTLEEYIRSCEQASHDHWNDESELNVMITIQSRIRKYLEKQFNTKQPTNKESDSSLSRLYTEAFLPPVSMETVSTPSISKSKTRTTVKKAGFSVLSNYLSGSERFIIAELRTGASDSCIRFVLQSETGSVEPDGWESDTLKSFPLCIESISVIGMAGRRGSVVDFSQDISIDDSITEFSNFVVRVLRTARYSVPYGIVVSGVESSIIRFRISVSCPLHSLSFEIKHSSEGGSS